MTREEFTVGDAGEPDADGICAIYNQAVRETFSIWSEAETTPALRRSWMMSRQANGFPVIVARSAANGAVLGYGSYGVFRDFPGFSKTVEHSVYVAPQAQRQGVGRAILTHLIDRAQTNGVSSMVGAVDSTNGASIALHRKLGFEQQGLLLGVGYKFGRKLDLVFMVRQIEI